MVQSLKNREENMVISEVVREEEEGYKIKAVSQCQQGRWTSWEAAIGRVVTWADLWRMPQARQKCFAGILTCAYNYIEIKNGEQAAVQILCSSLPTSVEHKQSALE